MTDDPLIGRQLSNFLVERVLGRGGMAQVYYGQDVKLQRPVAIKVIDARYRNKPTYAERFVKEARAVAKWRNEHIIQIYYADDQDELYYYVMEYIDGDDLSALMSTYTTEGELMPPEEIMRIGRAIADALDFAHSKGVIHRDVKPSNVLLSKDGRVVLGDFGLALDMQEGSSGEVFGTPHYISPEQARRSKDVVPQSDLYALGVILYEMLTGVVPFDDVSPTSVALQHITQPPPPPRSINPALRLETEQVLLKALSKTPRERYQSGAELMDALEAALAQRTDPAKKVLPLPPVPAAVLSPQAPTVFQNRVEGPEETNLHIPEQGAPPVPPQTPVAEPPSPVSPQPEGKPKDFWLIARWLGLAALLLIAGALFLRPAPLQAAMAFLYTQTVPRQALTAANEKTPTPLVLTASPTLTAAPSATLAPIATDTTTPLPVAPSDTPAQVVIEADTPTASPSVTATVTPTVTGTSPQSTGTGTPTSEATPTPTGSASGAPSTPTTTSTPTPAAGSTTPTIKYPNGKHFLVIYDARGLYMINLSDEKRLLEPFAFQRLDDAGQPIGEVFTGFRWSQFFPIIYPDNCIKIEITKQAEYPARPAECENRTLGGRFYDRDDPLIFWRAQAGSHEFRISWQDEEVARCEIAAGSCEVFIP